MAVLKTISLTFLFVALGVLLGAGVYAAQSSYFSYTQAKTAQATPTPTPTTKIEAAVNSSVYTDTDLGFSLTLPINYKLLSQTLTGYLASQTAKSFVLLHETAGVSLEKSSLNIYALSSSDSSTPLSLTPIKKLQSSFLSGYSPQSSAQPLAGFTHTRYLSSNQTNADLYKYQSDNLVIFLFNENGTTSQLTDSELTNLMSSFKFGANLPTPVPTFSPSTSPGSILLNQP